MERQQDKQRKRRHSVKTEGTKAEKDGQETAERGMREAQTESGTRARVDDVGTAEIAALL